jgi:acylphosphatase
VSGSIRRRVVVSGRVQGVFYRDSCRFEAHRARVGGWVRNLPDGRVEAAFEGDPASVHRLVSWCGHGPPRAQVVDVEIAEEDPIGETRFEVR